MRTSNPPSGKRAGAPSPARLLAALRHEGIERLRPLPGDAQAAAEAELRQRLPPEPLPEHLEDELTRLLILGRHMTMYERRWQERLAQGFEDWPKPPVQHATDGAFALVSEDELHAQLIGQPVIQALDRRFTEVLDIIDRRLASFAVDLGSQTQPANPFGPRAIVEGFLDTFPASEYEAPLRQALLRHLEHLAGERFGEFYAWFNTQLSEAGFAMMRAGDYAMLMASRLGGIASTENTAEDARWSQDNVIVAKDSTWRGTSSVAGVQSHDAERGNALRRYVRTLRTVQQPDVPMDAALPELRSEGFLAVLSLLQGDANGMREVAAGMSGLGTRLREHLQHRALQLGIERAGTHFSVDQEDAIDLVGLLFDRLLATHVLDANAAALLQRLSCPYLRLAVSDPHLFDDHAHPAHALLSLLMEQWDANPGYRAHDAEVAAFVAVGIDEVLADHHADPAVFERLLVALRSVLESRRLRADIAERRIWQSLRGRERLQAARSSADDALALRLQGHKLLDSVATFLGEQWRQALIHSWLREGPESDRYRAALMVGDAMIAVDQAAARGQGREVADGLITLQPALRDCYATCGLDESGAHQLFAALVAELSRPDAQRRLHEITRSAERKEEGPTQFAATSLACSLPVGQVMVLSEPGRAPMALHVAWISPLSARHLLVDRQGARQCLLSPDELGALRENGRLALRSPDGAVEGALRALAAAASDPVAG